MLVTLMEQYNIIIKRYKKALIFFDSDATHEQKLLYLPDLIDLTRALGTVLDDITKRGYVATTQEIRNGFEESQIQKQRGQLSCT